MRHPTLPEEYRVEGPFKGSKSRRDKTWYTVSRAAALSFNPLARIRTYADGENEAETYAYSKLGPQYITFPDTEAMLKWLEALAALGEL